MQDVHWSAGLFGYFPTYSLGAMYAAQIYKVSLRELSGHGVLFDIEEESLVRWEMSEQRIICSAQSID